ncbi:hypothetical protein TNIN_96231 [Trichonephila inaurata madagascariensis]|uniref:Uncharacterized protein n=1 Tax=Trichonephila inaurata madagascariensis TaxID=2747483 RepID=A0A8X6XN31_9ARAC|nr:hypothetical protein TNIN_96231 [Trichonephila inaurata madagascariensis]
MEEQCKLKGEPVWLRGELFSWPRPHNHNRYSRQQSRQNGRQQPELSQRNGRSSHHIPGQSRHSRQQSKQHGHQQLKQSHRNGRSSHHLPGQNLHCRPKDCLEPNGSPASSRSE